MIDIDKLLQGAIDMHMHVAPDIIPLRVDALEAAKEARNVGMKAIVLKTPCCPTALLATLVSKLVPEVGVLGSISLDFEVGGLNSYALKASAKLGAKVVWMPTSSAANSRAKMRNKLGLDVEGEGYSILGQNGELVPEIHSILSLIKEYDMVLASGHLSPRETLALFGEAKKAGLRKLVVTHASNIDLVDEAMSLEDRKQLVEMGAFIEHTAVEIMPYEFNHDPAEMAEAIKAIGAKHCIMSTDMGLAHGLTPAEGMRVFVSSMLRNGISEKEIELMIKINPAKLLGLD